MDNQEKSDKSPNKIKLQDTDNILVKYFARIEKIKEEINLILLGLYGTTRDTEIDSKLGGGKSENGLIPQYERFATHPSGKYNPECILGLKIINDRLPTLQRLYDELGENIPMIVERYEELYFNLQKEVEQQTTSDGTTPYDDVEAEPDYEEIKKELIDKIEFGLKAKKPIGYLINGLRIAYIARYGQEKKPLIKKILKEEYLKRTKNLPPGFRITDLYKKELIIPDTTEADTTEAV